MESLLFLLAIATPVAVWGGSVSTNLDVTITGASVVPTESHIIIDNPPTDGSDTLEKAIADIEQRDAFSDIGWPNDCPWTRAVLEGDERRHPEDRRA